MPNSGKPERNFIRATDLGQTGNPSPADGLQLVVTDLTAETTDDDLQTGASTDSGGY